MTIDPLVAGGMLILLVTFWFVLGVVDGTRPQLGEARIAPPERRHEPRHERELTRH